MERTFLTLPALAFLAALTVPAQATCSKLPLNRVQPMIDSFMLRPQGTLETYPTGGVALTGIMVQIVTTDPDTTLGPILDLSKSSNKAQKQSIGTALATAARQCDQAHEPARSRQIVDALGVESDPAVSAAFNLAYRGAVSLRQAPVTYDTPTHPLGRVFNPSPDVGAFGKSTLSNPFAPIR